MPNVERLLSPQHLQLILLIGLCAGVVFFDFAVFIYLTDALSAAFFKTADTAATYNAQLFGLFAAGYIARPVGGVLFGRLGDSKGRRTALTQSLLIATICTFIIAILPNHTQIGILAPILLVVARLGQGVALGGVMPAAWVFICEHLPIKNIGFGCSVVSAMCVLSLLILAGVASSLNDSLSFVQMTSWGWRVLFLIGGIISLVAYFLARQTKETPIFRTQNDADFQNNSAQMGVINLNDSRRSTHEKRYAMFSQRLGLGITFAFLLSWVMASLFMFIPILLAPLIDANFILSGTIVRFGSLISMLFMVISAVIFGYLVDRFNAGRILVFGGLFLILQSVLFFYQLRADSELMLIFFALLGCAGGMVGALPSVMVRLFPTRFRMTGLGIAYNSAYAIVGGVLPFALGFATFHFSFTPALYLACVGLLCVFVSFYIYYMPRTAHDLKR
ncbi:hypothetical protein B0181_05340 [Moraxella caviae]|uniref:Proline porter II n=1 Tax=Moraxella caviae TaxID=34060 RepID=A0A1T0A2Y0_9GAMM|nr:MFS transporter [Moraxella caviae]OOR90074.1 hypothetical protein B0181_05340 [Moraxella caviae]STZ14687.1 Proline porter II [Moraxella caviae]VEW12893.1 Proline porter II [Moraxella caviae]